MSNILFITSILFGEKSNIARNRARDAGNVLRDADPNREIVQRDVKALSILSGDTPAGPGDRA